MSDTTWVPWRLGGLVRITLLLGGMLPQAASGGLPDPPAPDAEASQRLLDLVGPGFKLRETDYFTIAHDTSHQTIGSLVGILKGAHTVIWRFCEDRTLPVSPPEHRLQVIFYDGFDSYREHCAKVGINANGIAGFYYQESNLAVFCNVLNRPELEPVTRRIADLAAQLVRSPRGRRPDPARRATILREKRSLETQRDRAVKMNNRLIIRHEAAHQILFNMGVHVRGGQNPGWLVEGLACQFEVAQRVGAAGLQNVNQPRLADFREAFDMKPTDRRLPPGRLSTAFDEGRFVRISDLICDGQLFQRGGPHLASYYAQAWGLVFYLQRTHPEKFSTYVRLIAQRRPGVRIDRNGELRDFTSVFGRVGQAFEREWVSFILGQHFDRRAAGR